MEMKFQDLPTEVKAIAAQTLSTLMVEERFNTDKKSGHTLAVEVRNAFVALNDTDSTRKFDDLPEHVQLAAVGTVRDLLTRNLSLGRDQQHTLALELVSTVKESFISLL